MKWRVIREGAGKRRPTGPESCMDFSHEGDGDGAPNRVIGRNPVDEPLRKWRSPISGPTIWWTAESHRIGQFLIDSNKMECGWFDTYYHSWRVVNLHFVCWMSHPNICYCSTESLRRSQAHRKRWIIELSLWHLHVIGAFYGPPNDYTDLCICIAQPTEIRNVIFGLNVVN